MVTITHKEDVEIINFHELTENEKSSLCDYEGYEDSSFFRYRENVYDLSDFMKIGHSLNDPMKDFDGYRGDSFFSGLVIKLSPCGEGASVALYMV